MAEESFMKKGDWKNLSTLGKVTAVGGAINPWLGLAGGLISGIGSGMSANDQLEFEKEKEKQRQKEFQQNFYQQKDESDRMLGLQGLDRLAAIRDEALRNHRFETVRNGVLSGRS